jgi:hypothetical protein
MKHLFVPYELALLAKEKGFNESCFMFYYNDGDGLTDDGIFKTGTDSNPCNAPLYQQLVDWFRVKHNIQIQQAMPIPKEAVVAANGKLDHISQRYVFYIYNEYANPRIVGKDQRSDDYYEALKKGIEEAFKLI